MGQKHSVHPNVVIHSVHLIVVMHMEYEESSAHAMTAMISH